MQVLGQQGAIEIPPGEMVDIDKSGRVIANRSGYLDTLAIARGPARPTGGINRSGGV